MYKRLVHDMNEINEAIFDFQLIIPQIQVSKSNTCMYTIFN